MLGEIILAIKEKPLFVNSNQHGGDDVRCTPPIYSVLVTLIKACFKPSAVIN